MIMVIKETSYDNFNDTYDNDDNDITIDDYERDIINFPEVSVSDYNPKSDWSGFILEVSYSGDSLSDYTTSFIVKADSKQQAINKLKKYPDFRLIRIDRAINSIIDYKKNYPYSNFDVIE